MCVRACVCVCVCVWGWCVCVCLHVHVHVCACMCALYPMHVSPAVSSTNAGHQLTLLPLWLLTYLHNTHHFHINPCVSAWLCMSTWLCPAMVPLHSSSAVALHSALFRVSTQSGISYRHQSSVAPGHVYSSTSKFKCGLSRGHMDKTRKLCNTDENGQPNAQICFQHTCRWCSQTTENQQQQELNGSNKHKLLSNGCLLFIPSLLLASGICCS